MRAVRTGLVADICVQRDEILEIEESREECGVRQAGERENAMLRAGDIFDVKRFTFKMRVYIGT